MPGRKQDEVSRIQPLSILDTLWFNIFYLFPWALRGLVLAVPVFTRLQARWHSDPSGIRRAQRFRSRYGNRQLVRTRVLFTRSVLVLDLGLANDILAKAVPTPPLVAQSRLNNRAFRSFMPRALFVSDGDERGRRRAFNEQVLNTPPTEPTEHDADSAVHHFEREFLKIAKQEVSTMIPPGEHSLRWEDFARLAKRITFRAVLGYHTDDEDIIRFMRRLERMIIFSAYTGGWLKWPLTGRFRAEFESYLDNPAPRSLAARGRKCGGKDDLASEATMWLFALKDALDTHAPRALALILAHPEIHARVVEELDGRDLDDPGHINRLALLEGCLHEAVRLWTPVQLILKRVAAPGMRLDSGHTIPADMQIAIHAAFLNRDPQGVGYSDDFDPGQWADGGGPDLLHFSRGPRRCAGSHIALFMMKAVLARLLQERALSLEAPRFSPDRGIPQLYNQFALEFGVVPLADRG